MTDTELKNIVDNEIRRRALAYETHDDRIAEGMWNLIEAIEEVEKELND